MWKLLDDIFNRFRICFSRESAFNWFVIIILGIMIRSDSLGISSVIRDLSIDHKYYSSMMQFFRANSWNLDVLRNQWISIVKSIAPLWQQDGITILIGDGVKVIRQKQQKSKIHFQFLKGGRESSEKHCRMYMHTTIRIHIHLYQFNSKYVIIYITKRIFGGF